MADKRLLELALKGLEVEKSRIAEEISGIQKQLNGRGNATSPARPAAAKGKRRGTITAAGRKALAEAMKRRWAAYRKGKVARPGLKAA